MRVYMTHPEHGAMHVYQQWHIDENLKNGWVIAVEPWLKPAEESAPVDDDPAVAPKRRGRPPKS